MTKKDFVADVVEQMMENPRKVLGGHGISAAVLQEIIKRPDVMSKLATLLWSLKGAKKGANGLRKTAGFKLTGYKTFPELNMKAREDVETFVSGISDSDAQSFTNEDNILTIIMVPETTTDEEASNEEKITSGKSVAMDFMKAVTKEYKIPGGMYLTAMVADSEVRPAEEKLANRKAKKNKAKQNKRTPSKIKRQLKSKAAKKLNALKSKREALQQEAFKTKAQLQQVSALGSQLGAKDTARSVVGKLAGYDKSMGGIREKIAGLTGDEKALYKSALRAAKNGKNRLAKSILNELGDSDITQFVLNPRATTSDELVKNRKAALRQEAKELTQRNEDLLAELEAGDVTPGRKRSIQSMISKNTKKVKALRAKLGTYKNLSVKALNTKAKMLKQVNDDIQMAIAEGDSIYSALTSAIDNLEAKEGEKEIIKQQVMEQVADGKTMQYAVQQAVQEFDQGDYQDYELDNDSSVTGGAEDLDDLLDTL